MSAVCHHGGRISSRSLLVPAKSQGPAQRLLGSETVYQVLSSLSLEIRSMYTRHDVPADQCRFWGDSIHRAGAGPTPIPPKKLNAQSLANAINIALDPEVKEMAEKIGEDIRAEQGELKGVESFHRHLPLLNMRYVCIQSGLIADVTWTRLGWLCGGIRNCSSSCRALLHVTLPVRSGWIWMSSFPIVGPWFLDWSRLIPQALESMRLSNRILTLSLEVVRRCWSLSHFQQSPLPNSSPSR